MARLVFLGLIGVAVGVPDSAWGQYCHILSRDSGAHLVTDRRGELKPLFQLRSLESVLPYGERRGQLRSHYLIQCVTAEGKYLNVNRRFRTLAFDFLPDDAAFFEATHIDELRPGITTVDLKKIDSYLFALEPHPREERCFFIKNKWTNSYLRIDDREKWRVVFGGSRIPKDDKYYVFELFFPASVDLPAPRASMPASASPAPETPSDVASTYITLKHTGEFLVGASIITVTSPRPYEAGARQLGAPRGPDPGLFQIQHVPAQEEIDKGYVRIMTRGGWFLEGSAEVGEGDVVEPRGLDPKQPGRFEFKLIDSDNGSVAIKHKASGRYLRVDRPVPGHATGLLAFGATELPADPVRKRDYQFDLFFPPAVLPQVAQHVPPPPPKPAAESEDLQWLKYKEQQRRRGIQVQMP
jgi:hypothetical protein